jgi:catechol 2,3-dioxygenase-like lactoylglutathione lyase family enzyme
LGDVARPTVGDIRRSVPKGPGIAVSSRADLDQIRDRLVAADIDVDTIRQLGDTWSLFFRDPDGMELEVCAPR